MKEEDREDRREFIANTFLLSNCIVENICYLEREGDQESKRKGGSGRESGSRNCGFAKLGSCSK